MEFGGCHISSLFLPLALNAYRSTQSPGVSKNRAWKNSPSVSATSPQLTNRKKKVLFSRKMLLSWKLYKPGDLRFSCILLPSTNVSRASCISGHGLRAEVTKIDTVPVFTGLKASEKIHKYSLSSERKNVGELIIKLKKKKNGRNKNYLMLRGFYFSSFPFWRRPDEDWLLRYPGSCHLYTVRMAGM